MYLRFVIFWWTKLTILCVVGSQIAGIVVCASDVDTEDQGRLRYEITGKQTWQDKIELCINFSGHDTSILPKQNTYGLSWMLILILKCTPSKAQIH